MLLKNDTEALEINILKRINLNTSEYWDANWLEAEIKLKVQGFSAQYKTNLRVEDFTKFSENITQLIQNLTNEIEFSTMEEGLYLLCRLKSTGTLICTGIASHENNNLRFNFNLDYMLLDNLLKQLQVIIKNYPLVGAK